MESNYIINTTDIQEQNKIYVIKRNEKKNMEDKRIEQKMEQNEGEF